MNNMDAVIKRLRDMRDKTKNTQDEIAVMLGITQQVYSNYESGKRDLPLRHLLRLADIYNVSTDYLLGRTSFPNSQEPAAADFTKNVSMGDVIFRMNSYTPNSKQLLVHYLNFLTYMENSKKKPENLPVEAAKNTEP